jgi:hypothetical protein
VSGAPRDRKALVMRPDENEAQQVTPIRVAAQGAAAGLVAALALSALARALPGVWDERADPRADGKPKPPVDPGDSAAVCEWQERSRSPAAFRPPPEKQAERRGEPPGVTPTGALAQPQGPGPEGLAEQFAFKVASGLMGSDISHSVRQVGMATHLAYGSLWGVLYGMIQAGYRLRPGRFGPLYGMVVYGVGPAFLVPAMKLMRPPREEPPARTAMLIFGHIVYGAVLAAVFSCQERGGR